MEYCAGGSVYKMLEDPANMHGLLEDEFLVFLRDISTSSFDVVCNCRISPNVRVNMKSNSLLLLLIFQLRVQTFA